MDGKSELDNTPNVLATRDGDEDLHLNSNILPSIIEPISSEYLHDFSYLAERKNPPRQLMAEFSDWNEKSMLSGLEENEHLDLNLNILPSSRITIPTPSKVPISEEHSHWKDSDKGKEDNQMVWSSETKNLRGQTIFSGEASSISFSLQGNESREMTFKGKLLRERAMECNRRKDLLLLLFSYPLKPEADQASLFLLRDKFININQMVKRIEGNNTKFTDDIDNVMESDVEYLEYHLDMYGFYLNLYYANLRLFPTSGIEEALVQICGREERHWIIDSAIRQILYCIDVGKLKVIGISSLPGTANAGLVAKALEDNPEIRSIFDFVISISISEGHSIREVQRNIAKQILRLPPDKALKRYKFLLFLHCMNEEIDLHGLKLPMHGAVVLTAPAMNVYRIMPVELEIKMEDHLLPWILFWKNVRYFESFQQIALQLIEACHGHLLAIILLARALKSVTDVAIWKLALQKLKSPSSRLPPLDGTSEVMFRVVKIVWEGKSIVTRHCIKHSTPHTKGRKLRIHQLVTRWIQNDLIETRKEGELLLRDLMDSFLFEEVSYIYLRMREETRGVLLKHFIPHLHPLHVRKEGLGLSDSPEVEEWDAKVINLNDNELSELPGRPNCAFLVKLFLQNNYNLIEIPALFFKYMPKLRVLDLSYTSIKSLPPSISKLVSLQEFLLRGCELLMELPPEIGALLNLQLFDLQGTEILNLPREIGKLTKLERLKVSFYGYGDSYRESKQIKKRIPVGLLSGLSSLKELSIDVNPDDEEWVADVVYFVADLHELRGLTTLKLYLPEIGLLDAIKWVPNFKFTVGHHKQRVISCLPCAVEKEFEKQENNLKYINGKNIPAEIKNVLKRTSAFFLDRHWTVKKISEFGNENMVVLKFCLLVECNELQTIVESGEVCIEGDRNCEPDIDKKPKLESLEYLGIYRVMNLRSLWEGPIAKGSLSKLKYLALHDCPNLGTVFTITLLGNLYNLEELIVEDCPKMNSLVSRQSSCLGSNQFLPSLKKLSLLDLPGLVTIGSGLHIAPKLEKITIYACPMLESLSPMELSSKNLQVIKGEIEWWDSLNWNESKWSSKQQQHIASIFVELKRDASLMDQLA